MQKLVQVRMPHACAFSISMFATFPFPILIERTNELLVLSVPISARQNRQEIFVRDLSWVTVNRNLASAVVDVEGENVGRLIIVMNVLRRFASEGNFNFFVKERDQVYGWHPAWTFIKLHDSLFTLISPITLFNFRSLECDRKNFSLSN